MRFSSSLQMSVPLLVLLATSSSARAESTCSPDETAAGVTMIYPQHGANEDVIDGVPTDAVILLSMSRLCGAKELVAADAVQFELKQGPATVDAEVRVLDDAHPLAGAAERLIEIAPRAPLDPNEAYSVVWTGDRVEQGDSSWTTFRTGDGVGEAASRPAVTFDEVESNDLEGEEEFWNVWVQTEQPSRQRGSLFLELREEGGDVVGRAWTLDEVDGRMVGTFYQPLTDAGDACVSGIIRAPNGSLSDASSPSCFGTPGSCAVGGVVGAGGARSGVAAVVGIALAAAAVRRRRARR